MADYAINTLPVLAGAFKVMTEANQLVSAGGSSPPVVTNVSPASGSRLTNQYAPIQFDVIDADGLSGLFISVPLAGKIEVIWNGSDFAPNYIEGSSRAVITDGFRFVVVRAGGWPEAPEIQIDAIDTQGSAA